MESKYNIQKETTFNYNVRLADKLKLFRKKVVKLSQLEFSKELGFKRTTYTKYEIGAVEIPISIIVLLHNKYNLNYDWFLHDKGNMIFDNSEKLIFDVSAINSEVLFLRERLLIMESNIRKIYRDFYAKD